ncbi:hypothetical protein KCP71_21690 [Salmonella enterica subsp. enterica]|nr:hypothetical protein KCP71_21690 [Salmonella enterica subsp. enterica]
MRNRRHYRRPIKRFYRHAGNVAFPVEPVTPLGNISRKPDGFLFRPRHPTPGAGIFSRHAELRSYCRARSDAIRTYYPAHLINARVTKDAM